jgi:SAM-dependent methyltransferase
MRWLEQQFQVEAAFGIDASSCAAQLWKERDINRAAIASADCLPFGSNEFGLVTCFDVVYQLSEEGVKRALSEMHRVLKPGGLLFIREPAYRWLLGPHDEAVGARHRFTLSELIKLVDSLGFERRRSTYANTLLFGAAVPHRLLSRLLGSTSSDVKPVPGWMNKAFYGVLRAESLLLERVSLPFGLSVILLVEKKPV